jgi:hypothetical protein
MNTAPWIFTVCLFGALVCACKTTPDAPREYEYEFTLEIDGKLVQRVRGKAREIIPKEKP